MKRLISANPSEILQMNAEELKQSINFRLKNINTIQ
ncbi:PEP phosphonomutase-like protein [Streptococcus pneumoniae]|nr:PEP phosphonomutase-like protein [Streptococcus pneumoniae]